jgi:biotin-dependent carboxylase-like uncharacterized protein
MARLRILRPGIMTTVQDCGRHGLLRYGVSGSGAIDGEAMRMANALVGNDADDAVLEFAQFGGSLVLDEDRIIAACGDLCDLRIDGVRIAAWQSHWLRAGQELNLGALRETVWGYLAISGGIDTPPVLGARATHLRSRLGGLDGRCLQANDSLALGEPSGAGTKRRLTRSWRGRSGPIQVILGPQEEYFAPEVIRCFLQSRFQIGQKRDRMAMLLEGPRLPAAGGHDIVSDGTLAGSIQIPASGQPIVLLADRQTTGGYPKIATIASVDLIRLAQMPQGQELRFQQIEPERAEELLIARRAALALSLSELEEPP